MNKQELHILISKYLDGTADTVEQQRLTAWYKEQLQEDVVWSSDSLDAENEVFGRIKQKIWQDIEATPAKKRNLKIWYYAAAAVILIISGLSLWNKEADVEGSMPIVQSPAEQVENRFVMLPDSSRVILRPGSRLEFRTDFKGATREVSLTGEAYFDISRKESQPFVVHTGNVKTVVLGTAFTIKTDAEQQDVQVTVQRGKVRVERERDDVSADLVADQQIKMEEAVSEPQRITVSAEKSMEWTVHDVRFDNQSFGDLTAKLERRYGIKISFKNGSLANCPVSGNFNGVDTLEEILALLCATRNATFTKKDNNSVEISGAGCPLTNI